ncbi:MAG: hypothetical protein K9J21_06170 [Bacteroidales bacterium]|nr:hypothetical protein [Bacteroidales bacterium]
MKFYNSKDKNRLTGKLSKPIVLSILFLLLSCYGQAQHKLVFTKADTVIKETALKNGNAEVFEKVSKRISAIRQKGFFQAESHIRNLSKDSTVVALNYGTQYTINARLKTYIQDGEELKQLDFQNYEQLDQTIEKKLSTYRNNGFPFASARSTVTEISDSTVSLKINLNRGAFIEIDTIILDQPDPPVSVSFLMAYLEIQKGDAFNNQKIQTIPEKISKLEFLECVNGPFVRFQDNKSIIRLKLKSKASNAFDGIIGFSTQNNNKLELTGNAMIDLNNTLRSGENLYLNWRAPGRESQSLALRSNFPYIMQTPFGVELQFELYKQDSSYLNLDFRAGMQYRFTFFNVVSFFLKHQSSNILSQKTPINNQNLDYVFNGLGVSYQYESIDSKILPHQGWRFKAEFTGGQKNIQRNDSRTEEFYDSLSLQSNQAEVFLLTERYWKPFPRSVFFVKNETKYIQNDQPLENQLFRLGGIKNLKGFDEDAMRVKAYSLLNLEYRFLLEQRSFLSAFWNGAITRDINKTTNYPMGFGAGIAFQTKTGIFQLYYALGKKENNPVDFQNSKIHFGFTSRF